MHTKFSPALQDILQLIAITPIVLLYQSSEIPVNLKASRNVLLSSDTLLKLTHLSLHSTSSQTLLQARRGLIYILLILRTASCKFSMKCPGGWASGRMSTQYSRTSQPMHEGSQGSRSMTTVSDGNACSETNMCQSHAAKPCTCCRAVLEQALVQSDGRRWAI